MGEKAAAQQQARFHELSLANLSKYQKAMHELAVGIWYEGCSGCGKTLDECQCKKAQEIRVYRRLPDRIALEALISHAVGKAVQKRETVTETEIVIQHSVPRPGGKNGRSSEATEADALAAVDAGGEDSFPEEGAESDDEGV